MKYSCELNLGSGTVQRAVRRILDHPNFNSIFPLLLWIFLCARFTVAEAQWQHRAPCLAPSLREACAFQASALERWNTSNCIQHGPNVHSAHEGTYQRALRRSQTFPTKVPLHHMVLGPGGTTLIQPLCG